MHALTPCRSMQVLHPFTLGNKIGWCMRVQVGIVGLPNVGKSTLFNTLTKMGIPAENFPFCTIDPNNVRMTPPLLKTACETTCLHRSACTLLSPFTSS